MSTEETHRGLYLAVTNARTEGVWGRRGIPVFGPKETTGYLNAISDKDKPVEALAHQAGRELIGSRCLSSVMALGTIHNTETGFVIPTYALRTSVDFHPNENSGLELFSPEDITDYINARVDDEDVKSGKQLFAEKVLANIFKRPA